MTQEEKHRLFEKVQTLALKTNKKMQETFIGNYKSAFCGEGLDYKESSFYNEGDSVQRIDWKSTAKTGKLFVKKFEETRKLKLNLIVDSSASLNTGFKELKKNKLIEALALIVFSAQKNGDQIALKFLSETEGLKFGSGKNHSFRILEKILEEKFESKKIDFKKSVEKISKESKGKSINFIFSDFEKPELEKSLKLLNPKNERICVFVKDNLDLITEKNGISEVQNPETGEILEIDWKKFEEFKKELKINLKNTQKNLRSFGIQSLEIFDGKSILDSFMEFFKSKQK